MDSLPGLLAQVALLPSRHALYKETAVQPSPHHLSSCRTSAATLAIMCKTSHTFRESTLQSRLLPEVCSHAKDHPDQTTKRCLILSLLALSLHSSSTTHVSTSLCRSGAIPPLIAASHAPGTECAAVTALLKVASGDPEAACAAVLGSPLAEGMFASQSRRVHPQSTPPGPSRQSVALLQADLDLLTLLTVPSPQSDLNNTKRSLSHRTIPALPAALELIRLFNNSKLAIPPPMDGHIFDAALDFALAVLAHDCPKFAKGPHPAFIIASSSGWLRRSPPFLSSSNSKIIELGLRILNIATKDVGKKLFPDDPPRVRSLSADNLSKGRPTRRPSKKQQTTLADKFKSDVSKLLASKATLTTFLTASGYLPSLVYLTNHPSLSGLATSLLESLSGPDLHVALVEQSCVPLHYAHQMTCSHYTPAALLIKRILKDLEGATRASGGGRGSLPTLCRRIASTLIVSGSSALRGNVAAALVLLTAGSPPTRRILVDPPTPPGDDPGIVDSVTGSITMARNANQPARQFMAAVDCVLPVDSRPIVHFDDFGQSASDEDLASDRFYGDYAVPPTIDEGDGDSRPLVVNIRSEDGAVSRMECPSINEIKHTCPSIASSLKLQLLSTATPVLDFPTYAIAEELLSHAPTNFQFLYKSSRKYTADTTIDLLRTAVAIGSDKLARAYARIAFETVNRATAARILSVAVELDERWLAAMTFKTISADFEGVLAECRGGRFRELVSALSDFLNGVLGK